MSLTTRKLTTSLFLLTAKGSVSGATTKLSIVFQAETDIYGAHSKSGVVIYVDGVKQKPSWTVNKTSDYLGTTLYTKLTSSTMTISKPFFKLKVTIDGGDLYEQDFSFYEIEKAGYSLTPLGGVMNGTTASTVQFGTTTSDATFKATFTLDSYSGTVSGASSTLSYTIPASWCAALPDATSGDAKVTGQILFGGVVYRTLTSTLRVSVPTSVVPSVTAMTFSDSGDSAVPSSWGIFVQNQSGLQLKTLTCAGAYGSTIKKVRMTADSKIQTAEYPSLPEISKITQSGDVSVLITVTDSRGRTGSMTSKVNFQPYAAPKLSSVKSERCDAEGNVDNDGMYFLRTTAAVFSSCSGKNAVTLTVQYKRTDLKTYGNENNITPGSNVCAANDLDPEYSYDVLYTLSDAFNTVTYSDYVSTAVYLMHFLHGGRGVAFGQKATMKDTLDCNFDAVFRKKLSCVMDDGSTLEVRDLMEQVQNNLVSLLCPNGKLPALLLNLMYPVGSIYMSTSSTNPTNIMGGTWVAWGAGRVPVGVGTGTDSNSTSQSFSSANATGGEYSHLLTASESGQKAVTTGNQSASHTHGTGHSTMNVFQVMKVLSSDETARYHVASGTKCYVNGGTSTTYIGERSATGTQSASHNHSISGSNAASRHNNIQPYITCYMWRRTA